MNLDSKGLQMKTWYVTQTVGFVFQIKKKHYGQRKKKPFNQNILLFPQSFKQLFPMGLQKSWAGVV